MSDRAIKASEGSLVILPHLLQEKPYDSPYPFS